MKKIVDLQEMDILVSRRNQAAEESREGQNKLYYRC